MKTITRRHVKRQSPGHRAITQEIGQRLRQQRVLKGLTQDELAHLMGISHQQVQKYEIGTNAIGIGRLIDACAVLDVDLAYFTDGLSSDINPAPTPHGGCSRAAIETTKQITLMTPEEQGILRGIIRHLLSHNPGPRAVVAGQE